MNLPKNRSMLALLLAFVLLGFTPLHWNAPVSVASIVSSNRRTPDSPTLSPISSIGGVMRDVQVVGNLAYIGEGPSLAIVDVSDPAAPVVVSRTYVAAETRSVVVVDDRAYVAANTAGLYIFDVSDPSTPRQIGHWDQRTHAVVVSGDLAYVTDLLNLTILDVADPGDLQVAGSYAIPAERGYTGELAISGQYVYLTFTTYDADFTNWLGSLYIVDVATPASPALLGSYTLPACDVNSDGTCNVVDALFVLQCDVGIANHFCLERSVVGTGAVQNVPAPDAARVQIEAGSGLVMSVRSPRPSRQAGWALLPSQCTTIHLSSA